MNFEEDILKGKYFPLEEGNRLKATRISLLCILIFILFFLDFYESYKQGYTVMSIIEAGMMVSSFLLYLLFPYVISLNTMIYGVLSSGILFLLVTLGIDDVNSEVSLFWIATLPTSLFYFLGAEKGGKWNIVIFTILLSFSFVSYYSWITFLYDSGLLFQIAIGYLIMTYWVYLIEKEKSINATSLSEALKGKEILFKEVHHRTKNNMQVMMGLLETQSFKISDPQYKKMFQSHVERIKVMSLVHENLYKNERYEKVDTHKYLEELSESLQKFTPHTIITEIDFIFLDMKTSMNLGLIFNEAVSNAIEHAYSVGNGYIDVSLRTSGKECVFRIKDYGRGFNAEKIYHTLGMTLMEDLSASLPNGRLEINADEGTEIKIYFTLEEEKK